MGCSISSSAPGTRCATASPIRGEPNYLYINTGDGTFLEIAENAGVEHVGGHMGVQVADFDLDGWLDIYLGSGGPNPSERQQDLMFLNDANGAFIEVPSGISGINNLFMAHGVAFADFDADGDLDFFVGNGGPADKGEWSSQPNRLYINNGPKSNFLYFAFRGTVSNRSGLGVVVEAVSGERTQRRELIGGSGFASHNGLVIPLGFGIFEQVESVTVTWPSGVQQSLFDVSLNQRATLVEPKVSVHVDVIPFEDDPSRSLVQAPIRNYGPARTVRASMHVVDSEGRVIERLLSETIHLEEGESRSLTAAWDAVDQAPGRYFGLTRLRDLDSGEEINLGVARLDLD